MCTLTAVLSYHSQYLLCTCTPTHLYVYHSISFTLHRICCPACRPVLSDVLLFSFRSSYLILSYFIILHFHSGRGGDRLKLNHNLKVKYIFWETIVFSYFAFWYLRDKNFFSFPSFILLLSAVLNPRAHYMDIHIHVNLYNIRYKWGVHI